MRHTKLTWLAWLVAFAMIVAACGGDEDTATTDAPAEPDAPSAEAPDEPADTPDEPADEPADDPAPMVTTDFGVDLEAGVIRVGMLSDLTGPFGPLVSAILAGSQAYWDDVNANGGIGGLQVELVVRDTVYVVDNHVQLYGEIKDQVVMIGHSTGSPHTVAINDQLQADSMLTIPLTWYSGWSDPAINASLLSHGLAYCVEAHNTIGYITEEALEGASTIAIASVPGDYGLDSAEGAKMAAAAAGLEIVYDGAGGIIPTDETTLTAVASGIVDSGADIVWVATTPSTMSSIFGQALAAGFTSAVWSGPSPSFNPAFVAPDSPIKDAFTAAYIGGTYTAAWGDVDQRFRDLLEGLPVSDYYFEGIVEAQIVEAALRAAYDSGDMTRAGVLAAGKSLGTVDFDGVAPAETYAGEANDRLQRVGYIFKPDPEGLAAGTSGGRVDIASEYTSSLAANLEFTGACYVLGG